MLPESIVIALSFKYILKFVADIFPFPLTQYSFHMRFEVFSP